MQLKPLKLFYLHRCLLCILLCIIGLRVVAFDIFKITCAHRGQLLEFLFWIYTGRCHRMWDLTFSAESTFIGLGWKQWGLVKVDGCQLINHIFREKVLLEEASPVSLHKVNTLLHTVWASWWPNLMDSLSFLSLVDGNSGCKPLTLNLVSYTGSRVAGILFFSVLTCLISVFVLNSFLGRM